MGPDECDGGMVGVIWLIRRFLRIAQVFGHLNYFISRAM